MISAESNNISQLSRITLLGLLDFCKGIAIILVLLTHLQGGGMGWEGVHLFIVLSGFGLTYACLKRGENLSWKQWYLRRLKRILPGYWLICILGYLVMVGIDCLQGFNLFKAFWSEKLLLLLELTLLQNFSFEKIVTPPNVSIWFVPFIVSFYLVFPWFYRLITRNRKARDLFLVFLGIISFEFIYRALAIYWLDGSPIGYKSLEQFFPVLGVPFNKLPNHFPFEFQEEAPFGFFPARIGEFVLGMIAAVFLMENKQNFQAKILNIWAGLSGFFIFCVGNQMLYMGFWGWVFADFFIAIGLTIWILNMASFFQKKLPALFEKISLLGIWSYYIFLTHFIFIYLFIIYLPQKMGTAFDFVESSWWAFLIWNGATLAVTIAGIWITCRWLKRFDQSKLPDLIIDQAIAGGLKSIRRRLPY